MVCNKGLVGGMEGIYWERGVESKVCGGVGNGVGWRRLVGYGNE